MFASAMSFNFMLSIVPLLGLVLIVLSTVVSPSVVIRLLDQQLTVITPSNVRLVRGAFTAFLKSRELASGVGLLILVVFSGFAFRSVDEAMRAVFDAPKSHRTIRKPITSLLVPLVYIFVVGTGLFVETLVVVFLETFPKDSTFLGYAVPTATFSTTIIKLIGFLSNVALLTSFYKILPEVKVNLRHAVVGATVATVMWGGVRRFFVWYVANLSFVGLIYGSLTTVVVLLLTFELASIVVLLGAQVIAEIGRSARADLPWHEEPTPEEEHLPSSRTPKALAAAESSKSDGS